MPTFDRDTGRRSASPGVCITLLLVTLLVYLVVLVLDGWIVDAVWYFFLVYCIFLGILLRSVLRQHFGIGPMSLWVTCWDGMLEDCLLATFCSCCSAIQMARHTHDETRYPYTAGSTDGLPTYAPDMWAVHTFLEDPNQNHNGDGGGGGGEAEMAESPYRSNPSNRRNGSPSSNGSPMANVEIV